MSSVPVRAGVGFGCCFQEGVRGAFPGVFPEKVFLSVCVVAFVVLCVLAWAPAWVWGRVWGWGPVPG